MRYLVFGYNHYYPQGGMEDCLVKTDLRSVALEAGRKYKADLYQRVYVYDTKMGETIYIDEDV
jgi:hypothetical protein